MFRLTNYTTENFNEFREQFRIFKKETKEKRIDYLNVVITTMNLLSVGPNLIPGVFLFSGWDLSLLVIIVLCFINFITTQFIIESISIMNAIQNKPFNYNENEESVDKVVKNNHQSTEDSATEDDEMNESPSMQSRFLTKIQKKHDHIHKKEKIFSLKSQFEYSEIAAFHWGKGGMIIVSSILIFYLSGRMVTQSITVGQILSRMFQQVPVLNNYYFWLCSFYLAVLGLSLMTPNRNFAIFQMTLRFTCVFIMILGSLYIVIFKERTDFFYFHGFNNFTAQKFQDIFSSLVFSFLIVHIVPSDVTPLRPEKQTKKYLITSFLSSTTLQILVPIMGGLAFGQNMTNQSNKEYKFFVYNFEGEIEWIYYTLSIFLTFSVFAFVNHNNAIRHNLMRIVLPDQIPQRKDKNQVYVLFTALPLAVIIFFAGLIGNVEKVIQVTGSVFGVFVLMIFPTLFLILSRQQLRSLFIDPQVNFHKTYFNNRFLPYIILLFSIGVLIFNITTFFNKKQ